LIDENLAIHLPEQILFLEKSNKSYNLVFDLSLVGKPPFVVGKFEASCIVPFCLKLQNFSEKSIKKNQ